MFGTKFTHIYLEGELRGSFSKLYANIPTTVKGPWRLWKVEQVSVFWGCFDNLDLFLKKCLQPFKYLDEGELLSLNSSVPGVKDLEDYLEWGYICSHWHIKSGAMF